MITYVKKSNADKYSFLYEEASEALRTHDANGNEVEKGSLNAVKGFDEIALTESTYEPGRYYTKVDGEYMLCEDVDFDDSKQYYSSDTITSLNEYFSYIVELNAINRRYTILPLDEDVFEINANTRVITVPASFKSNGIAVQGDEVAEIVYFKINRFYDAIDLDTKDIYIQWKSPALDESGRNITGVSVPWVKDVESEPGYIIFGWPLSSKITQAAGTVQFSVRFYEYNAEDETLTYSLSTLTQSATIKPGLDFDLPEIITSASQIDDVTDLINDRFENSSLTGDKSVKAEEPIFVVDLPELLNLDTDDDGFRVIDVTKSVEAIATDGGQLSYYWKKYSLDDNSRVDIDYEITMSETTDTKRQEGKLYYQIASSGIEDDVVVYSYTLYNGELDAEDRPEKIFERYSSALIDSTGKYYVVATNRVRNSTASTQSTVCIVPKPVAAVIADKSNLADKGILEDPLYDLELKIKASVTDAGKITYQWYRKAPGATEFEAIEDATLDTYTIVGSEEESAEGAVGDGYYKVIATNNVNKETIDTESNICRVTHPATRLDVTISEGYTDDYTLNEVAKTGLSVTASFPADSGEPIQRTDEDTITYQWYRYYAGNSTLEKDLALADAGEYKFNGDTILSGATAPTYTPTTTGYFYCQVTNTYNGTTADRCSRFFNIVEA